MRAVRRQHARAHLIGIEYLVFGALSDTLREEEKPYWHPHDFEVLSGQLMASGLPEVAEGDLFEQLRNSCGKTWHTWHTGRHDAGPGDALPLGEPKPMWSFNREGECDESLKRSRDEATDIGVERAHEQRRSLTDLARPQCGVDAMRDRFTGTTPVPGVTDAAESE
ncbi:hypothetical protein FHX42_002155 [Saccharopolyspora lacisalsi]|uniref:Uncharacterized protein n=1 Tax=Halosaccharopolyspora lacisalsi TaxID=1000566 RepID=A0A839E1H4_9PSEU|nr:DUF1264 domain-containing protein [Halosaccharopolyspora lacisalsi]MBA8824808.1 hypothetical protein [Halosaccharopolyspora lacisalsi]